MSERVVMLGRVSRLCILLGLVLAALVPAAASADPAPGGPLVGGFPFVLSGPRRAFAAPHARRFAHPPPMRRGGVVCEPSIACAHIVRDKQARPNDGCGCEGPTIRTVHRAFIPKRLINRPKHRP